MAAAEAAAAALGSMAAGDAVNRHAVRAAGGAEALEAAARAEFGPARVREAAAAALAALSPAEQVGWAWTVVCGGGGITRVIVCAMATSSCGGGWCGGNLTGLSLDHQGAAAGISLEP